MSWLSNVWHESSARRELAALAERLGVAPQSTPGWAPALVAAVDQHAAAVRDILLFSGGRLGPIELVGYARGVQDVAIESGWQPAPRSDDADWTTNWVNARLAAVCLLAAAGTVAVAVTGGEPDPSLFF